MSERELVEYIVKTLVAKPDDVKIDVVQGERSTIRELHVGPEDLGRVIGKSGRIAQAMRTLLTAMAAKTGRRVVLEIID